MLKFGVCGPDRGYHLQTNQDPYNVDKVPSESRIPVNRHFSQEGHSEEDFTTIGMERAWETLKIVGN